MSNVRVAGRQHATLAGRDVLDRMETEHRDVAVQSTDPATTELSTERVRGILHDGDAARLGKAQQRVHVARLAGEMHRENRARSGTELSLHGAEVNIQRFGLDVGEHWRAAREE